jgi:hypothetical protein
VFLWLLANGKVLTRDNLAKRRHVDDSTFLFCNEAESAVHVFFDCCVVKWLWQVVCEVIRLPLITNFEGLAYWWLKRKKIGYVNVVFAAVTWSIWKM